MLGVDAESRLQTRRVGSVGKEAGNDATEVGEGNRVAKKKGEGRDKVDLRDSVRQKVHICNIISYYGC